MYNNEEGLDPFPTQVSTLSALAPSLLHKTASYEPIRSTKHGAGRARECRMDRVYYPLGFPVRVHANNPLVLTAAERSWGRFNPLFDRVPLSVKFRVEPDLRSIRTLPSAPHHEFKDGKLILSAGPENVLLADLKRGCAIGRISESSVRCQQYFRYHFLEGAVLSLICAQHCTPIHAACIEAEGKGMLLCGDSGEGKSTLAFASARSGCVYISDDASYLVFGSKSPLVVGNCHSVRFRPSAKELFPEIAGFPVTPRAAGKPSIEADTAIWPVLRTAPASLVRFIVFLNRKWIGDQQLVAVQADRARVWFESLRLPVNHRDDLHDAALDQLLTCRVFELRYHDLDWAVTRLKQLAKDGV